MPKLLLDFDRPSLPRNFDALLHHCVERWMLTVEAVSYARSRRGWHVAIYVRERLCPGEIVAMQALLGSDPARERLNLGRARRLQGAPEFWRRRWNVLYSRKL